MKRTAALLPVLLALVACNNGGGTRTDLGAALLTADEVREGCVASTLDLIQDVADRLAPLAGARTQDAFLAIAAEAGCAVALDAAGGGSTLFCPDVVVRGEPTTLRAQVEFLRGDEPADIATADRMRAFVEAEGLTFSASGTLTFRPDVEQGLVVDGGLDGLFLDGCALSGVLDRVTARTVADAAGSGFAALFTAGNIDFGVDVPGGAFARATAALAGRTALVALELAGVFSQSEIALGQ
mgnify:CR=1 FL=1